MKVSRKKLIINICFLHKLLDNATRPQEREILNKAKLALLNALYALNR